MRTFDALILLAVDIDAFVAQVAVLRMDWIHGVFIGALLVILTYLQRQQISARLDGGAPLTLQSLIGRDISLPAISSRRYWITRVSMTVAETAPDVPFSVTANVPVAAAGGTYTMK